MKVPVCCWLLIAVAASALEARAAEFDSARVSGRVLDATGKPIPGAKVLVNRTTDAKMDMRSMGPVFTAEDGHYELTLRFGQGQTCVVREVFAEKKGFVRAGPSLEIPLRNGDTTNVSLTLQKGEVLAGTLKVPLQEYERDEKPEKVQRWLEVSGPKLEETVLNARVYETKPGGHFEMYVPSGQYTLKLLGYGQDDADWKGIRSGQTNVVLELAPFVWSETNVARVFDQFWVQMDRHYSYFFLKKDVDWASLEEKFRSQAMQATNAEALASALQQMLAPLKDLHVWIRTPSGGLPSYRSSYNYNGNRRITLSQVEEQTECGPFAIVGKTKQDGFGCFVLLRQGEASEDNVREAIEAIRKQSNAPGFLVDLRSANGGSEPLALKIASLFCAREIVYARSKYRDGAARDAFTQEHERTLPASANPYTKPVVCLTGPGAVSSGEGFVQMMRCLPNVTTVGLPTRGASGNPRPWELGRTGVTVYFSRWVDLLPDGTAFEGVGISPAVEVNAPLEAYRTRDPTLEKGLDILRAKVAALHAVK